MGYQHPFSWALVFHFILLPAFGSFVAGQVIPSKLFRNMACFDIQPFVVTITPFDTFASLLPGLVTISSPYF